MRASVTSLACVLFFFFNDTATTEIYTLSLHDALPIWTGRDARPSFLYRCRRSSRADVLHRAETVSRDRKSTRLNSSHLVISYAVFCLKKKKKSTYSPAELDLCTGPSRTM